jgi:hypothetical protein
MVHVRMRACVVAMYLVGRTGVSKSDDVTEGRGILARKSGTADALLSMADG